jgi:hypothetical protein
VTDTSGFGIVPRYLRGTLTAYEIAMYVALSWRADEHGVSWARQSVLAKEAGMGRTKAQEVLRSLEEKGIVKSMPWANGKGRSSNIYALRVWAEPVLSDDTIRRTDGHRMADPRPSDQQEQSDAMPPHGTTEAVSRQTGGRETAEVPQEGGSARVAGRPMPATRAAEVEPLEEDKHSSSSSSSRSESPLIPAPEDRGPGGLTVAQQNEAQRLLGIWPGPEYINEAASRWSWLTAERGWDLTQKYLAETKAKQWNYSPDGWLKFMEREHEARERRTRGRAYAPNGVPL